MSSIDRRIVDVKFDNAQFERNIQTSMRSLEAFNKQLEMDDVGKSLAGLTNMLAKVDFSKMEKSLDTISSRFTTLGIMGKRWIESLAHSAEMAGKRMVRSLSMDQLSVGFSKYEEKTASVQTLVNATGKSVDEISTYLDQLMWFSDETSYGFTDMTSALATMVSSGGDVERLIPMIMGVANATALAGKGAGEFSRVMYNLNQSYGLGHLQAMDWKSVEMAGAGSKQLKQMIIDTGVEMGKISKGKVDIGNFIESLKDKWATQEVMEAAFGKFSEFTLAVKEARDQGLYSSTAEAMEALADQYSELGVKAFKSAQQAKTFKEVIDATKDAVSSGWMRTYELIFGDLNEATSLWSGVVDEFYRIFAEGGETRNELLEGWRELGGRDHLLEVFASLFGSLELIRQRFNKIMTAIFGEMTPQRLFGMTKGISDFFKNVFLAIGGGQGGKGLRLAERFSPIFKGILSVLDLSKQVFVGAFKGISETVKSAGPALSSAFTGVVGFFGNIGKSITKFVTDLKVGDKVGNWFTELGKSMGMLLSFVIKGGQHIIGFFGRLFDNFKKSEFAKGLGKGISDFVKDLPNKLASGLKAVGTFVDPFFKKLPGWADQFSEFMKPILAKLPAAKDKLVGFAKGLWATVSNPALWKNIWGGIKGFTKGIPKFLEGVWVFGKGLYQYLRDNETLKAWIKTIGDILGFYVEKIKGFGITIWNAIKNLFGIKDKEPGGKSFVENLKEKFATPEGIKEYFDGIAASIRKAYETVKKKIVGVWEKIRNSVLGLFKKDVPGFKTLTHDEMMSRVIGTVASTGPISLAGVKKATEEKKTLFDYISESFRVVADFIRANWGWFAIAAVALIVIKVAQFATKVGELYKLWLTLQLKIQKNKSPLGPKDTIGTTFLKIAGSMAIVVGAIWAISQVPKDRLWSSVGIVAGIAVLMTAISLLGAKVKASSGFGLGMMGIGIGIFAIVESIKSIMKILSDLDNPWKLVGAIGGVAVILIIMTKMAKGLRGTSFSGDWKTIIAMAASIWVVIQALKPLLKLTWSEMGRMAAGLVVIGFVLKSLIKASSQRFPTDKKGSGLRGLIGAGIAIWLIIKALQPIGKTPKKELYKMAAALLVMRFVLKSLIKVAGTRGIKSGGAIFSLVGVGVAIWLIFESLRPIAKMSGGEVTKILVAMFGLRLILTGMSKVIRSSGGLNIASGIMGLLQMVALAGVMWSFGEAVYRIREIDTDKILAFSGGLSSILISFGVFSKLMASGGLAGILAIGLALAAVGGLVYWAMNNEKLAQAFQGGFEFLGDLIGRFTGAMEAAHLTTLANHLQTMSTNTYDETGIDNTLAIANKISAFSEQLPEKGTFDKLLSLVGASELGLLSADIARFGTAMGTFATEMSKVGFFPLLAIQTQFAIGIAKQIKTFADGLEPLSLEQSIAAVLGGSPLGALSGDIARFGTGMNTFAQEINKIESFAELDENTKSAIAIAKEIQKFSDGLQDLTLGESIASIWGGTKLSAFSKDMNTFATQFNKFAKEMDTVEIAPDLEEKTTSAVTIAEKIQKFADGLAPISFGESVTAIWGGTKFNVFSGEMSSFAKHFNTFSKEMNDVKFYPSLPFKTMGALVIAGLIKSFAESLPDLTLWELIISWNSKMKSFSSDMANFGRGIASLATSLNESTIDAEFKTKVDDSIEIAESLAGLLTRLSADDMKLDNREGLARWLKLGDSNQESLMNQLTSFGSAIGHLSRSLKNITDPTVFQGQVEAAKKAAETLQTFMSDLSDEKVKVDAMSGIFANISKFDHYIRNFKSLGSAIHDFSTNTMWIDQEKFSAYITDMSDFAVVLDLLSQSTFDNGKVIQIADMIHIMSDYVSEMAKTINDAIAQGIQNGDGSAEHPVNSAWSIVLNSTLDTVDGFKEDFETSGKNLVQGLADGISKNSFLATNAINSLTSSILGRLRLNLAINSPSEEAAEMGMYFNQGFSHGVIKHMGGVLDTTRTLANGITNTFRDILGIHSFADTMISDGKNWTGGFISSVDQEGKKIFSIVEKTADKTVKTFRKALDSTAEKEDTRTWYQKMLGGDLKEGWDDLVDSFRSTFDKSTDTPASSNKTPGSKGGGGIKVGQTAKELMCMETVGKGLSQGEQAELLARKLDELGQNVANMKIVMDGGALVGQIAPRMDSRLAADALLQGRR